MTTYSRNLYGLGGAAYSGSGGGDDDDDDGGDEEDSEAYRHTTHSFLFSLLCFFSFISL